VTICIAAICTMDIDCDEAFRCRSGQEVIIGISDRMVSSDCAQAEFPLPKYSQIVGSIVLFSSGSNFLHRQIFESTKSYVLKDFDNDPRTIPVIDVAELYSQNLIKYRQRRLDNVVRAWTGLEYENYLKQIDKFNMDVRKNIETRIAKLEDTEAIITGIDEAGAHVYHIRYDGSILFNDKFGLSAIGSGSQIADIKIIQNIQTRKSPFKETLIDIYMAKKHAELDPFVGEDTDIFIISTDHSVNIVSEDSIKLLDDLYNEICAKQKEAIKEAGNRVAAFIKKDKKMELI
jgi:hypothetical protein